MIRVFTLAAAGAAALLLNPSAASAADPLPAEASAPADPAVTWGTMANGMRYAVMRNGSPAAYASVRLVMDVGSFDEEEDERGYAHFIEHLAFRATKGWPEGALNRFAALGVAVGRDQNASTSLTTTLYHLDLPRGDTAAIATALGWMRSAADSILFTPAAVEGELGVVLAELHTATSAAAEADEAASRFQSRGLRSADRAPIGTEESLRKASPAALQAFYERWYRPERATLVIVGDAPAEELKRAAEEAFASWFGRGEPGRRAAPPAEIAPRGLEALSQSHPALAPSISACRLAPLESEAGPLLERMRRDALSEVWTTILANRFRAQSLKPGSPLLTAAPFVSRQLPDARVACLGAMPATGKWDEALKAAQAELRRFAADGPTETEVESAIEQIRSRLRGAAYSSDTRVTPALANAIAGAAQLGRPFQHPHAALATFEKLVAGVKAADIQQAFAREWSGTGPILSAAAPAAPPEEALLAAWRANEATDLVAYEDEAVDAEWRYLDFGKKGKVRKREEISDAGAVRLHYRNGTIVNFKQTAHQSGGVEIRVRFGHGEHGLDASERTATAIAGSLFPVGGLGRMDFNQISAALENTTWSFNLEVETSGFVLGTSTLSDQAEQQLFLLAAYLTDPAFGPLIDEKLPSVIEMVYASVPADPGMMATDALERALFPDKQSLPSRERMMAFKAADLKRVLGAAMASSPIEVTVVGDIDEKRVTAAVAATFGALPARRPYKPLAGPGPFRHYPATLPAPVGVLHDGPRDKAAALLQWPLYVATPERRHEEYAILAATTIFQNRLLEQVRVSMGMAYSPVVAGGMIDGADQGAISAQIEAAPSDLPAVIEATRRIAGELAAGKISQDDLDEAREPLVAGRKTDQFSNAAWASILSHSARHPEAIDELVMFDRQLGAVTLDDVRRAAATWLGREPAIATATPRAGATDAVAALR